MIIAGLDVTSRLIRSGQSDHPSRRILSQSDVLEQHGYVAPFCQPSLPLNHQDLILLRHGMQPTANRLPLFSPLMIDRGSRGSILQGLLVLNGPPAPPRGCSSVSPVCFAGGLSSPGRGNARQPF